MDIIATESQIAKSDAAQDRLFRWGEAGVSRRAIGEDLNIETTPTSPFLPADRKWALRFKADGTVTIVLGMRDYGRGWFSAYFAGFVTARLGIPFRRVRVYYSGSLPAVLQAPRPSRLPLRRSSLGPVARAAADVIDDMCDRVIEKGRLAFAAIAGVRAADIGFDQPNGLFFVLDRDRSGSILGLARAARGAGSGDGSGALGARQAKESSSG
jgi:CO/xanthine dehydrogenase Mo-binding subunit